MTSMFLGFPYIIKELAAHLFGVPHGHEHSASVSGGGEEITLDTGSKADPPHLPK